MSRLRLALVLASPLFVAPAFAQSPPEPSKWTGEGAFSAGYTTGNTETTDAGFAVKVKHVGGFWTQQGEFSADYGETDNVSTKNRLYGAGQVDRIFGKKLSGYTRATWERDEFSGFENRYFVGLGLGYKAIDNDATKWTLEGGPGYKIDEVRATATTPADREDSVGARAGSRFKHAFNDKVSVTNDTDVLYSNTSTQTTNSLALNAALIGRLSARVSLDVRYDTEPPEGFKSTDTTTKFSLVYKVE